jgi:hypothetical protein
MNLEGRNKTMKHIFLLSGLLILVGCYNNPDYLKPAPWVFKQMPSDAPNNYKRGWRDGCESGFSSMTSTTYKTFYSFKQDAKLRDDPVYYKAWKDTYDYCRHYIYGTIRQSNQRMDLPNNLSEFHSTFMGARGIFEEGMLNMWGPPGGRFMVPFANFGTLAGDGAMGNVGGQSSIDFSDDVMMNGKEGGMDMNFEY